MESGKPYILALDLGIASIGWSIAPCDQEGNVQGIEAIGTHVYPSPISEIDKGRRVTKRATRGAIRRARRRLLHFHARRRKLVRKLTELGWWPSDPEQRERIRNHEDADHPEQPLRHAVQLKVLGLHQPLEAFSLGKILLHYQRHRGYLSTAHLPVLKKYGFPENLEGAFRESDAEDEGKTKLRLNDALARTRALLRDKTVSKVQWQAIQEGKAIRARKEMGAPNKEGRRKRDGAIKTELRFDRWMYIQEFRDLWQIQAKHRSEMDDNLRREIEALVFHQADLESKEDKGVIGTCEYLPNQRRCRNGEMVFQRSRILQFLNNLTLRDDQGERKLQTQEIDRALAYLIVRDQGTWSELKEAIGLSPEARFDHEPIPQAKRGNRRPKAAARDTVKGSGWGAKLAETLELPAEGLAGGAFDDLVHDLLSIPVQQTLFRRLIEHHGIPQAQAEALLAVDPPKGYAKVCARVLRKTEPHLRNGMNWHDALRSAGYKQAYESKIEIVDRLKLEPGWTTGNPSVDAAVKWSARIVNQIVERYGKPLRIRVELPRQMALGNEARNEIWEEIKKKEKINDEIRKQLEQAGLEPKTKYVQMVHLWREAGGVSPYDPEVPIPDIPTLIASCDIDHIVPLSYNGDDTMANKTIALKRTNAEKGGKTPFEAWNGTKRWESIQGHLANVASGMKSAKKKRILAKSRPELTMEERMKPAIGYVGKVMRQKLESLVGPGKVDVVNGQMTAFVRRFYAMNTLLPKEEVGGLGPKEGFLDEKNREDLRHHALDAAAVAMVDRSLAMRLTRYFQAKERGVEKNLVLEPPFPNVRERLQELLPSCPVVHPPRRSAKGALHKQTMEPLDGYADERGKPNTFEIRGQKLLRFGPEGTVTGAWEKSTVHHGLIYETISGKPVKPVSVSLFEVAQRVRENELRRKAGQRRLPLIRPEIGMSSVCRFRMSLSNGDIVEYTGSAGDGPGYYRVGTIAVGNSFEITLYPLRVSKADPKAKLSIRVTSLDSLAKIHSRVMLNVFGEVVFREPASGG